MLIYLIFTFSFTQVAAKCTASRFNHTTQYIIPYCAAPHGRVLQSVTCMIIRQRALTFTVCELSP